MTIDAHFSDQPVDVIILDADIDVLPESGCATEVIMGFDGAIGREGPPGPPGQDGAAQVPEILDGGNF